MRIERRCQLNLQQRADASIVIGPITDISDEAGSCENAVWIGQVDEQDLVTAKQLLLTAGEQFSRARLLVWANDKPRGFVELPVSDGRIAVAELKSAMADWPPAALEDNGGELPAISVVVCTRDRPDHLRDALANLVTIDYPEFELIVVDNNPASGLSLAVVESFEAAEGVRIRRVEAHRQGLSIARNVALRNASHNIVAFTDDDVLVDRRWLRSLARGFGRRGDVACVCGIVPSAELMTPAQIYFDRRVGWARRCEPAVYDLAEPPAGDPLFPMRVAEFGTGANFAVQRDMLIELGGFDEGLGIGSPSGGGEDIDVFVRVLLAGHSLVREPSAVVWHRHRRTIAELETQVTNYGLGLGAWIAKLGTRPRTFGMALKRIVPAVKHLRRVTVVEHEQNGPPNAELEALYGRELRGVMLGPMALLRARLSGRNSTPLSVDRSTSMGNDGFGRSRRTRDAGNLLIAERLSLIAVLLGFIGSLGAIRSLPTIVLAPAVGAFLIGGPGSLALSWYSRLPAAVLYPLIPAVSIAICLITVSGLLMLGFYDPVIVLLGLTGLSICAGLAHCAYLVQRRRSNVT